MSLSTQLSSLFLILPISVSEPTVETSHIAPVLPIRGSSYFGLESTFPERVILEEPNLSIPIWRLQLRVVTGDGLGVDGTSDKVWVNIHPWPSTIVSSTTLDLAKEDFKSGSDDTYDLSLEGIKTLGDIEEIILHKRGDDFWTVAILELIVNGKTAFKFDFRNPSHHIRGLSFDERNESFPLRRNRHFFYNDVNDLRWYLVGQFWERYTAQPYPRRLFANELKIRIESVVGDFMSRDFGLGYSLRWLGTRPIEVEKGGSSAIHVNLLLAGKFGTAVHVDFRVEFGVKPKYMVAIPKDLRVSLNYGTFEMLAVRRVIQSRLFKEISRAFGNYRDTKLSRFLPLRARVDNAANLWLDQY